MITDTRTRTRFKLIIIGVTELSGGRVRVTARAVTKNDADDERDLDPTEGNPSFEDYEKNTESINITMITKLSNRWVVGTIFYNDWKPTG